MPNSSAADAAILQKSLHAARDTRRLAVGAGVRRQTPAEFAATFGQIAAAIVADVHTFDAAGRDVVEAFRAIGAPLVEPFVFGPDVHAEYGDVERLEAALQGHDAIPVAVGSGTINDLTKLASYRLGRPYMAVATAASMDGYTAFGASITHRGSKQTFDCPAPRAVVADLEVIAAAPFPMNAWGYADLLAKNVAGADWMLADAAGVEPIDPDVWQTVQCRLKEWVGDPSGVAQNEPAALAKLIDGLLMSGFAMQAHQTSRPASGADHQFSHLWDMQGHTHNGVAPSHGFKVGVGTLASTALHDFVLGQDLRDLDVDQAVASWPSVEQAEARILELFGEGPLAEKSIQETRAKYLGRDELRVQLVRLRDSWPELRERLADHLIPFDDVLARLRAAGCPDRPEEIGITRPRLRLAFEQAYYIRRRFTVLDLARRFGLFDAAMDRLFGPGGRLAS
jgi:glycerol-1-phosphate dehydrogenase [NAD(P)+]